MRIFCSSRTWRGFASPGLVVFEYPPLLGIDDGIERCVFVLSRGKKEFDLSHDFRRKYRILDNCARLSRRSLMDIYLFISWNEDVPETLPDASRRMARCSRAVNRGRHTQEIGR